jgi:hypothetical protein
MPWERSPQLPSASSFCKFVPFCDAAACIRHADKVRHSTWTVVGGGCVHWIYHNIRNFRAHRGYGAIFARLRGDSVGYFEKAS